MYQYERKGKEGGLNNRSNAVQLAKKGADSKWEGILQLAGKKRYRGSQDVDDSDDESDEDLFHTSDDVDERSVKKQRTRKDVSEDEEEEDEEEAVEEEALEEEDEEEAVEEEAEEVSEEDEVVSDDAKDLDFVDPSKKKSRPSFYSGTKESVVEKTAHKRKNKDESKFDEIYTCPLCRRPLAFRRKGVKVMEFIPYNYTSRKGHKNKTSSLQLDHYPIWADRDKKLKEKGASKEEVRKEYNDEDKLRAICIKCNQSHAKEESEIEDYESGTEEEGYSTPLDESDNKGVFSKFKYDKDGNGKGGGGTTV